MGLEKSRLLRGALNEVKVLTMSKADQVRLAAEPVLEPGEVVEVAGMAVLGKFNVGKSVALGIATSIATLGMVSVMTTPVPQPIVITTKRFLVLGIKQGIVDKPDSKIVTAIPRADLRARPAKRVALFIAVDVTDPQGNKVTRMKFSFFAMADAKKFAEALGEPAAVAV